MFNDILNSSKSFHGINFSITILIGQVKMLSVNKSFTKSPILEIPALSSNDFIQREAHTTIGITSTSKDTDDSLNENYKVWKIFSLACKVWICFICNQIPIRMIKKSLHIVSWILKDRELLPWLKKSTDAIISSKWSIWLKAFKTSSTERPPLLSVSIKSKWSSVTSYPGSCSLIALK